MDIAVETRVGFGDFLSDVFGSTDLLGRIGKRAIVLDWKFGDGVAVEAEDVLLLPPPHAAKRKAPATETPARANSFFAFITISLC